MARNMSPTWKTPYYRFGDGYTPLKCADFDVPPRNADGNKSLRPIWESVGKALSHWAFVEGEMYNMFVILIQSKTNSARRALGSLLSVQSQLDVIKGAAEQCFQSRSNKNLIAINKKFDVVRAAVPRRNEFAHGQAANFTGRGHFLVPYMFSARKTVMGKLPPDSMKYCYTSNEIRSFSDKFIILYKEMFNLNADVRAAIHKTYPQTRP